MIDNMQSGSVIYDLAAIQGGNSEFTEVDKIVVKNGVKIMGETNILINFLFQLQIYIQKMCLILCQIYMIKKIIRLILI
jgi:NAD/NADP transhydrogenase alpha subunit